MCSKHCQLDAAVAKNCGAILAHLVHGQVDRCAAGKDIATWMSTSQRIAEQFFRMGGRSFTAGKSIAKLMDFSGNCRYNRKKKRNHGNASTFPNATVGLHFLVKAAKLRDLGGYFLLSGLFSQRAQLPSGIACKEEAGNRQNQNDFRCHCTPSKTLFRTFHNVRQRLKSNRQHLRDSRESLWSRSFFRKLVRLSVDLNVGLRENAAKSRACPRRCNSCACVGFF